MLALPRRPDRVLQGSDLPRERPDKASDQLAAACAGLLKIEEELRELAYQSPAKVRGRRRADAVERWAADAKDARRQRIARGARRSA